MPVSAFTPARTCRRFQRNSFIIRSDWTTRFCAGAWFGAQGSRRPAASRCQLDRVLYRWRGRLWDVESRRSETALGVPASSTTTNGGRGWFGTAGGGCDYQFKAFNNWNLVAGPFGDFDLMNSHGVFENPSFGATGGESERSAWAIGGRLGYLIGPPLLAYMNGGFSQTKFDSVTLTSLGAPAGSFPSHMYDGWFVGGGTEYALTWLPGLFWRNEYRFASYRSADLPLTPGFFPGSSFAQPSMFRRSAPRSSTSLIGRVRDRNGDTSGRA